MLQIHDRKHSQSVLFDGIEERVGKPENLSAEDCPDDQRTRLREINDGLGTSLDLIKKGRPQPWTFRVIRTARLRSTHVGPIDDKKLAPFTSAWPVPHETPLWPSNWS